MSRLFASPVARALAGALCLLLSGCALLAAGPAEPPSRFVLEAAFEPAPEEGEAAGVVLLVVPPLARPGFDGSRMIYVTRAYEVQSFARSEWVDAPARMLAPLLVQALERVGGFRVVQAPSAALATLRLDTEILALQQEFTASPSRVRLALRAQLVDAAARRVLATTELEAVEEAPSDDPYGGVVAANQALARVLRELALWARAAAP